ncbi:MAG: ABC transporter permease subunit, partial [Gammaproteobacteria bacterium]|nr:ABC transporter permease subunit [Gammaproteobacteria bacterium]
TIVVVTEDGKLQLTHMLKEESLLSDDEGEVSFEIASVGLPDVENIKSLLIDYGQQYLYVAEQSGYITVIDINTKTEPRFIERKQVVEEGSQINQITFLTGGISILVASSSGEVSQWFPVRKGENTGLTRIRTFIMDEGGAIRDIETEQRRKGFVTSNEHGVVAVHHSTAHRTIVSDKFSDYAIPYLAMSPRADHVLAETTDHNIQFIFVENEHPEISWAVLWSKIWYESYDHPDYTWQSSSASNDFEPKYSLMPLAFGTLKAAFYAMLFAVPLAIMGAIYTAYFMAPKMRTYVKPAIEIMEALPTVILGFLAGLWLAPVIETHLLGVFAMLIILPVGVLGFALGWQQLPAHIRGRIPEGWQAALLIPVLFVLGWLAMTLSAPMETVLFSGDLKAWLNKHFGIGYDQRNSLVVGIAMGVAVIPTIFSIAEDAIFSVPKHLTFGSLALGATPWQTMSRVVLLTASPGIFSAVMIGMGRAVGETMIVLMATGNTPVMDFSIFQGMRTLSANIAVEMPESEVDSTHYRVLFLAALVLFIFTFMFNTVAEIVRHRLRKKYSSL